MVNSLIIVPEVTKGMKSLGSKALLKINDSISILEYQVQQLRAINKKNNIYISIGFEADKVCRLLGKYKVKLIHNQEYLLTNQVKSIDILLKQYSLDNLLIISNGILFRNNIFESINRCTNSQVFVLDKPKNNFNIGCVEENTRLDYLFYDLPISWSECAYLNTDAILKLKEIILQQNIDQMYLFEIINALVSNNIIFDKYKISKKDIMKINNINDLNKARTFI